MNPYHMWKEQSPRQVFELLKSNRDMNKEIETDTDEGGETKKKNYTVRGKVKIPDWYTVPEGATVYHADDVFQENIFG